MKTKIFTAVMLFASLFASAQQMGQFTQFFYNKSYFNPAFVAVGGKAQVDAVFRGQWMGIEGAPAMVGLNYKMPLINTRNGIGVSVYGEQLGNYSNILAKLSYAYSLPIGQGNLTIGISGGVYNMNVKLDWVKPDTDVDTSIPTEKLSSIAPNVGIGLSWNTEKLYIGLSSLNTLEFANRFDQASAKQRNHIYLMSGYSFEVGRSLQLIPAVLLYTDLSSAQASLSFNSVIVDKIIAGVSYRTMESFGFNVGYIIGDHLQIGYSYDLGTGDFSGGEGGGSHEVILSYRFSLFKLHNRTEGGNNPKNVKNIRFL